MAKRINNRNRQSEKPPVKEKFVVEGETFQQQAIPRFSPATVNQKLQLQYLKEGRSVVFSLGAAGVGKSLVAAYHAACLLKEKED